MEPPARTFSIEHHADSDCHIVTVLGDLDIFSTPDFSAALERALGTPRLIIDLSHCHYIDSSGISTLFRSQQKSRGKVRLVIGGQEMIHRIFKLTRVDKFIEIFTTVDEAKA